MLPPIVPVAADSAVVSVVVFQPDRGRPARNYFQRMRDHIHTVVGRQGKIKTWDVVNEAISDSGTNILRNSLWLENHRAGLHR